MKLLTFLRFAPLSLLLLVASCAQTPLISQTSNTRARFHEKDNTDLVLEYYRPDTIYMKRPDAHEGPFLTIFNRDNITFEIMQRVSAHNLAVVVIGQFHDEALEAAVVKDWESVLGGCGFQRVVFLRAGLSTKIDGLPIVRDTVVASLSEVSQPVATIAIATH